MLKITIWTSMPSLHQRPMYLSLLRKGVDLQVRYFEQLIPERVKQGWPAIKLDIEWENFIEPEICPLESVLDWRERVHIISGYRYAYLRRLVRIFCSNNVDWVHWSEAVSNNIFRSIIRWPVIKWYGRLGRKYALGAFSMDAIGSTQFAAWGFNHSNILHLPYSIQLIDSKSHSSSIEYIEKFAKGRLVFAYIGTLSKRKGTDILLSSCNLLNRMNILDRFCVILVGPEGEYKNLNQHLRAYGLSDLVMYAGVVQMQDIQSVVSRIAVLIHPSRYDGWGATVSEAALSGKAVISTSAVASARVLISHGSTGFLIKTGDVKDLARAILFYTMNPKFAENHGKSIQKVAMNYSADQNADRLINGIEFLRLKKYISTKIK